MTSRGSPPHRTSSSGCEAQGRLRRTAPALVVLDAATLVVDVANELGDERLVIADVRLGKFGVEETGLVVEVGKRIMARPVREGACPGPAVEVCAHALVRPPDVVRHGLGHGVRSCHALDGAYEAGVLRPCGVDPAVFPVVVAQGTRVLLDADGDAIGVERGLRKEGSRRVVDALGAHEVVRHGVLDHRGMALLPEKPGVEVGLNDGVDLVRTSGKVLAEVHKRELLREHEGMHHAIEHVMAQKTEREGATDAFLSHREMAHALAKAHERPGHAYRLELSRKTMATDCAGGERGEAYEERVGPLVSEEEREKLLVAVDDTGRERSDYVLAEDVVRDDRGHSVFLASLACRPPKANE